MKPEHVKAQAAIMCEVERHNPLELKFDTRIVLFF